MKGDKKASSAPLLKDVAPEVRRELWDELQAEFSGQTPVNKTLTKQARLRAVTAVLAAVAEFPLTEQRAILRFVNDMLGVANKRWSRN